MDDNLSQDFQANTEPAAIPGGKSPPPSEWHESTGGKHFDLHADRWQLSARISVNVTKIRKLLRSDTLKEGFIRTLAEDAKNLSAGSVKSRASALNGFLHFSAAQIQTDEITEAAVVNYRHHCLGRDGDDRIVAGNIRSFLTKLNELGYPGVTRKLVEVMEGWRLKSPATGVAVNRLDANEGPLMPDEHVALAAQWLTAFEQGKVSHEDFLLTRLVDVTGRRPLQLAHNKLKDMDDSRFEDHEAGQPTRRVLLLSIPRIKGRGSQFRTRFRAVPLSADLWNLLVVHRRQVHERFDALLANIGLAIQPNDLTALRDELPLFPMWSAIRASARTLQDEIAQDRHGAAVNRLREIAASDAWHFGGEEINIVLDRVMRAVDAKNRVGKPLEVFPRRFRYTHEFDLERAGCSPPVIAWNMDHSDTMSLSSYSKNGPDKAVSISKAMALSMAPLVKMFQGRVVDKESDAEGGDNPDASRILFDHGVPGASCAVKRNCRISGIPRCCYNGCSQFQPWVDGPHEQFLELLLEERERDLQTLRPVEDCKIIEAADSIILGIVQVIHLCESRRKARAEEENAARGKRQRKTKGDGK